MLIDPDYLEFEPIEEKLDKVNPRILKEMLENEDRPPFEFREQFREVLLQFFNLTNHRHGAYEFAEGKAKEYFNLKYDIPISAWNFRVRKPS
jgi:hypothetical protein